MSKHPWRISGLGLLLGVATTLLIACGCARWIDLEGTGKVFVHAAPKGAPSCLIQHWSRSGDGGGGGGGAWCIESIPTGDATEFFSHRPELVVGGALTAEFWKGVEQASRELLPPFGLSSGQLSGRDVIHRLDARGWPLPAICRQRTLVTIDDPGAVSEAIAAYESTHVPAAFTPLTGFRPTSHQPSLRRMTELDGSWRPHWPGLLIDSALYAVAWLFLGVAFKLIWFIPSTLSRGRQAVLAVTTLVLGIGSTMTTCWSIALFHDAPNLPRVVQWFNRSVNSVVTWRDSELAPTGNELARLRLFGSGSTTRTTQPAVPSGLTGFVSASSSNDGKGWHLRQFHAVGWPMLAMWSGRSQDIPLGKDLTPIETVNGIELGASIRQRLTTSTYRALPVGILWPGFIINSLAASAGWLLLACLCISTWRGRGWWRIRRRQCPKCGYPIGTSFRCTECGRELPAALQEVVRQGADAR